MTLSHSQLLLSRPWTFSVLDHVKMQLTGLGTVRVSQTQTLTSGRLLSGQGEQAQQKV